jgi:ligand-binding sensor domain-containing protein
MNHKKQNQIACLLSIVFALSLRLAPQAEDIPFIPITRNEGLSKNSILSILQDREGFMWFATESGLNKFDGNEFTVFRHVPGDPASLSHNYLLTFYEDREGIFWIGTFNGGLNRFDPSLGEFRCFRHVPGRSDSLSNDTISAICEDRTGALWIGTDNGLNRFDRRSGRFTYYPLAAARTGRDDQIHDIHEDRDGSLWIATYGNGLYRLDHRTGKFSHYRNDPADAASPGHDYINCVHEDRQGGIWIGSDGGLDRFDRRSERLIRHPGRPGQTSALLKSQINAICEDQNGSAPLRGWLFWTRRPEASRIIRGIPSIPRA